VKNQGIQDSGIRLLDIRKREIVDRRALDRLGLAMTFLVVSLSRDPIPESRREAVVPSLARCGALE